MTGAPTSPADGAAPPTSSVDLHARILRTEVLDELRGVVREPATLFFSVAMPVGFFALFAGIFGGDEASLVEGQRVGTTMLATFGTFGVVGTTLLTPGIGVAEDRERGWLRAKRVSPTPLAITLAAKVTACVPHALGVLAAMTIAGLLLGGVELAAGAWLRLALVLVLGALPFSLLGLAVGFVTTPNTASAVLMALYIPASVASGLMLPLELLPAPIQTLAPLLPTYHLAELGLAQLGGTAGVGNVLALAATTVVAAGLAALAYRRAGP